MGRANQLRNAGVRQTIPILHLSELPAMVPGVRASEQATGEGSLMLLLSGKINPRVRDRGRVRDRPCAVFPWVPREEKQWF